MPFHHSRPAWQLAALLLAALLFLPSIPLAQSPPSTPSSVSLTRADGTVTANWPAPDGATKYHVTYSTDGGKSWHAPVNNHTNVTTTSIEFNADNAKTYVVGVRAGNDNGQWSGWRNSPAAGPYTPPNNPNPPAAVSSVTLTRADGTVTADWPAPDGAAKYHVTYTTDGGKSWHAPVNNHTNLTGSSLVFSADNAKTYVVGVRAGNAGGWSGWRNSPASGPYTPPPPAAPTGLTAAGGNASVTLAWSDPSDASITGYEYALQQAGHDPGAWTGIPGSDAATTSYTATGLTNGTAYTLHLRALNAGGSGVAAQASATPNAPGIIVQDGSGNAITALAVPEGGEASYQVKLASKPAQDVEVCIGLSVRDNNDADITFKGQAGDVVALNLTFTPANWNTAQTVTLAAAEDDDDVNGARDLDHDAREYYPGKVDLAATEVDNDQLTVTATRGSDGDTAGVSWTAYAGEGFAYYRVIVCDDTQYNGASCVGTVFTSAPIWNAASTGPVTATGLNAGTGYGVIVQVWRNGSALKRHATLPALDVPAAPANLAVTPGDGYLDIAWDAVSDATGYDVRAKTAGSTAWHDVASNVTTTSHRYTPTETIDYVAVRARNANGPGNWTELSRMPAHNWLNTVQQGGASIASAQAQSQLAAPTWGTITRYYDAKRRSERIDVKWTGDSNATGYNLLCAVSWSVSPGWNWHPCGWVDAATGTVKYTTVPANASQPVGIVSYKRGAESRLPPGIIPLDEIRMYAVAIRSVSATPGEASEWVISASIKPLFPELSNLTYTRGNGQITLRWTPNPWTTGYEIDCAVLGSSYTRCATLTNQDHSATEHSATISTWTAGGTNYAIDNTKTYDIRICSTNTWGYGCDLPPLIPPITLTVSNITWYTARLTLSNYPGDWYYKANTGPDNSCKGPVSSSRTDLAGLDEGGTYAYSAYSDNRCANLLVAAAAFTTQSLAVTNVAQTTATIALTAYTGNWYYKADTGPDATACQGPVSGSTAVDLTGLTAGVPYTYRAYDDNTCIEVGTADGTAHEIAFARFTTIEITLTASNVTDTGATLTIANHSGDWYYQHSGQGASCQGPVTGNSQSLTTLTSGTSYTYSAYSDAGCATLLATAATFTLGQHHVSSLSSVKSGDSVINNNHDEASAFTTGSNASGYTLTSVTLPLRVPTTAEVGSLAITLHEMEGSAAYGTGSAPSATVLATLSGTDPSGAKWADTTYTCSGNGCGLSANTTYFLVASNGRGEYAWAYTTTNPHPEPTYPANSGWDIGYSHSKFGERDWTSYRDWHPIRIDFTTDAGGTGTAQTAPTVVATATVRDTNYPVAPAGAAAQAADRAGNAANAHEGSGRGEAATASATRSPGYVTNLASAQSGDSDVDATQRQAVAFTTGPSPGGYTLKRFTAALRKVGGNADLVLTLHDMASDAYGDDSQPSPTVLATLAGSAPASGAYTDVTYTCSGAGCDLQPDATYFVVAQSSGSGAYAWAYVASANLYTESTVPSGSGWTLGAGHYADNGGDWTSWGDWHHARLDFETHPVLSVGNLAEAPHPDACFPSGDTRCAVGFTTGSAAGGYTLRALTARFEDADDPDGNLGDLVVTLHEDNAGLPGPALATLSGDNPAEAGDYTYTCSGAGCALKPDTAYFVQVSATAGAYLSEAYAWAATLSDHETPVPSGNGWTLANGTTAYRSTWQTYPDVGLLAIFATR